MHAIRIVYRVRIVGGELRDEVDGSTDTCAWFTPGRARATCASATSPSGSLARVAAPIRPRRGR